METQIPVTNRELHEMIDVDECRQMIKSCVADLAREHALLAKAKADPQPLDEQTRTLLGLGPTHGLTTLDMAQARVTYFESAQDRLWMCYKKLIDG